MLNGIPPSGRWKGYYLYSYAGVKHQMSLDLTFANDGRLDGDGIDDIAPFIITGHFDCATSQARWLKAYRGMHTVQYTGAYCPPSICGDWILGDIAGGFWIWPSSLSESELSETVVELELELGSR
jgi:ABC-type taurine transport system substrate-binding protein